LGGLTVLFLLPPAVSTAHAALAEIFFCMTVAIAVFTSPAWIRGYDDGEAARARPYDGDRRLRTLATFTTVLIYAQILVGATMRHTGAGLAIPDFPWMFGHLIPDHWNAQIAVNFTHRVGAVMVTTAVLSTAIYIWRRYTDRSELGQPGLVIVLLTVVQITLGALTIITRRDPLINSVHVVCGALVLTTSLVITLRSWRGSFADETLRLKLDTARVAPSVVRRVRLHADVPVDEGGR